MNPAKAGVLVVGVWMGLGGLPAGTGHDGLGGVPAVLGLLSEGAALAANPQAEGRKHARKANHLAEINKCKLAIPEYTKALRLLKDPTLLFNRAECYRRTGDAAKAVADYRKFLLELPAAPNRAQVESQIAALDKSGGKSAASAAAPPSKATAPRATAAPAKTAPPEPVAAPVPSPTPVPGPAPVPPAALPPASPPVAEETSAEPEAPDLDRPRRPPPRLRASPKREPTPALIDSASQHPEAAEGSSHWWAWVLGAVVIAGGAAGTYFALKQGKTDIPSSALGNYKF